MGLKNYNTLTAFQNSGQAPSIFSTNQNPLEKEAKERLNNSKISTKAKVLNTFGDFNSGMESAFGSGWGAGIGNFVTGIGNSFAKSDDQKFTESQQATQGAIRSAISAIPVYGQIISAATGLVDSIGSMTGTNLSNINQDSANRTGLSDAAKFNNLVNNLPGVSMLVNGIGSIFGGGKSDSFTASKDALAMSDAYGGSVQSLTDAEELAGKNYFGNWKNVANSAISSARNTNRILSDIGRVNTMRKQSDHYQDLQNQNINRYAGQNYRDIVVGKSGLKLMSAKEARRIIALRKIEETIDNTQKFQNGGNIPGIDTNLLPEGSLHKELNHLSEINSDLEDVTKKGIPVVENSENQQVAEIEHSEIIFRLEVTEKLEELMKDGSDEAMIEAGKLITFEVIENSQDNTGEITEENGNTDSKNK